MEHFQKLRRFFRRFPGELVGLSDIILEVVECFMAFPDRQPLLLNPRHRVTRILQMGDDADLAAEMGGSRSEEVNGFRLVLEGGDDERETRRSEGFRQPCKIVG